MTEHRALHQDIRPLKIVILNLMPKKIETETQLLRLLGNSPPMQGRINVGFAPFHNFAEFFPILDLLKSLRRIRQGFIW